MEKVGRVMWLALPMLLPRSQDRHQLSATLGGIWAKLYCYFRKGNTIFFCLISLEQTIRSPSCPTTKYMTLVLKFFCCNKVTITRRRLNLFPKFRKIPAALDEYFAMAVSNRDLKPFWTFFLKNCMRPRIRKLPKIQNNKNSNWS